MLATVVMASINFAERENATIRLPALKIRQQLVSAPDILKTPMTAKNLHTPMSCRKALGAINKIVSTPAVNRNERTKPAVALEPKNKTALQNKVDDYPDIERFIPYDPLEFENYLVPEDVVRLSHLALPGLASFPETHFLPKDDMEVLEMFSLSPVKNPQRSGCSSELDTFLQTINELTVDMPPELPD